jgi:UDP-glucose 4-epimerase
VLHIAGIFMSQILRGEPLTIFGDGTQTRAFSYIDDVAPISSTSNTWYDTKN